MRALERELRAARPEPPAELVSRIVFEIRGGHRRPSGALRLAFAGALTSGMLVALAAVGGISYAATAVQEAAEVVKQVFTPSGAIEVRGISSGGDQYRPGFGWGDPNHTHEGPPGLERAGGELAPPLRARETPDGKAAIVSTRITLDEQALLSIFVTNRQGKRLVITQKGSKIGRGVKGPQTKVILYQVLVPRTIPLRLRIPANLLKPGRYFIVVQARDTDGVKRRLRIPFTVTA